MQPRYPQKSSTTALKKYERMSSIPYVVNFCVGPFSSCLLRFSMLAFNFSRTG